MSLIGLAEWGYVGLFVAAFLAATILPLASEVVFTAVVWQAGSDPWICVMVATVGNTLGGMTCYWLGLLGKIEWIERFLRIKKEKVEQWVNKMHRQGDWLAFFSFLPGVGDFIAVAAGFIRCKAWIVLVFMTFGKFVRYVVWMYLQGFILN